MNPWTGYKPPVIMIDPGDGVERPVRGLGVDDLGQLIVANLDAMMEVTSLWIASQKDVFATGNSTDILMIAAKNFPELVREAIALATDEPELRKVRLGAGAQIKILQASFKLTVEDAGGLGNLSAMLSNAVRLAVANQGEASRRLQEILSPASTSGAGKTRAS